MRAQSVVLPAVGVALVAEAALAWHLYVTTHQSYDRGDALALFAFVPTVVLALCGYMLFRSIYQFKVLRSSPLPAPGSALVFFAAGAVIGLVSFWLAFEGGPHVAGFVVFWPLLFQVLLFGLGRASVRRWTKQVVALTEQSGTS